jgi:tyrosyl-tRNA synthetase
MGKIRDLQQAGVHCRVFLADWHTWINDKLGGNREAIKKVAAGYFKEGLKATLAALGGKPDELEFILGSDLYHNNDRYWETLIEVCKNTSLARIERSISIMGRQEGEAVDFAKLMYPPMQVADVFMLQANIAQGGIDQRKAHVIARDVALQLKGSPLCDTKGQPIKPVIVHHHLLLGLAKPPMDLPIPEDKLREVKTAMKMSKSKPDSAIFIHDDPDTIRKRIRKAFCPPNTVEGALDFNPVLDWTQHLIFNNGQSLVVKRRDEPAPMTFPTFEELRNYYATTDQYFAGDLKEAVAQALIDLLEPVRKRFDEPDIKAMWDDLEGLL